MLDGPLRSLAAALALACASPAPAAPLDGFAVSLRGGLFLPSRPHEADVRQGDAWELALSRDLLPWLGVELSAGITRTATPHRVVSALVDPSSPSSATTWYDLRHAFTAVPVGARLRLLWPVQLPWRGWSAHPWLAAGGGAAWGQEHWDFQGHHLHSGWGPEASAALGAEVRLPSGLTLGLEARGRWARATLHQRSPPLGDLGTDHPYRIPLGGGLLLLQAGWRL